MKDVLPTLNICADYICVKSRSRLIDGKYYCKVCKAKAKTVETLIHRNNCIIGNFLLAIAIAKKEVHEQIVINNLSYIRNCIIDCKKAPKGGLFEQTVNGMITRLDGYAIVPVETYEKFKKPLPAHIKKWKKLSAKVGSFSNKKCQVKRKKER